ncbi:MAG: DUF115 domain-containing protein [Treponema sp.]|nr:DUF115 domain-containing protein [Treponema sp.]
MDRFERNLRALSPRNPDLCARLRAAGTGRDMYGFRETRSGETVPAILGVSGVARPLHSTVDPKREAERLVSASPGGGFVVFLGLGAGFAPAAALGLPGVFGVLVIDYGIDGVAGLFRGCDYSGILGDPRLTLLVDPPPALVESAVLELYRPALCGGIRILPLRARTEQDKRSFDEAGDALRRGVEKVSADYSVQAHFGTRWFSNIIRNVMAFRAGPPLDLPPVREAAICAAGPSLDAQIPFLLERKGRGDGGPFVISTDTALPALAHRGLRPDAVVSMDCQHVSYHHFMGSACRGIPLFLDIASPPLLSSLSGRPVFFCGGHPLAAYLRRKWAPLPVLDTSGGNVTFACLSLAESLGATRIAVLGADFSYPGGKIYARGTYVFPYFERRQNRFSALEAQVSAFLFRVPFLPPDSPRRYETATMRSYRLGFERKASGMAAEVSVMPGLGIPVIARGASPPAVGFAPGKPFMGAAEFLKGYLRDLKALPSWTGGYPDAGSGQVFATLLPQMAALGRRWPELSPPELLEAAKRHAADQIGRVLGS